MVAVDMEMPKCCAKCCFRLCDIEDGGYYCTLQPINGLKGAYYNSSYNLHGEWLDKVNCPLVEIVTCKDCTYDGCAKAHSPNHFCADAVRRE